MVFEIAISKVYLNGMLSGLVLSDCFRLHDASRLDDLPMVGDIVRSISGARYQVTSVIITPMAD